MGIMGMGWQELTVIAVIAVIIFGPDKLPEMAGQAGKLLRDFRKMTQDMTGEFEKQTGVNVRDLKQNVDKEIAGLKSEMAGTTNSLTKELNSVSSSVSKTAKSVSSSVSSKASTSKSATSKSGVGKGKTASTAKTASSISSGKSASTAGKSSTIKPAPPPVASKQDPLADVSFFDPGSEVSKNGTPAVPTNGASTKPAKAETNGVPSADRADAIARARSRRTAAGYNQGPTVQG